MREVVIRRKDAKRCDSDAEVVTTIKSPWLSREEAAVYLGWSPSFFNRMVQKYGVEGRFEGRAKRYHIDQLDQLGSNSES